jgi:hypothetical protein
MGRHDAKKSHRGSNGLSRHHQGTHHSWSALPLLHISVVYWRLPHRAPTFFRTTQESAKREAPQESTDSVTGGERGLPHTVIARAEARSNLVNGENGDCPAWGGIVSLLATIEGDVRAPPCFPLITLYFPPRDRTITRKNLTVGQ